MRSQGRRKQKSQPAAASGAKAAANKSTGSNTKNNNLVSSSGGKNHHGKNNTSHTIPQTSPVKAGKMPGKKTSKSSSPSVTLNEILNTLGLEFDAELGVLNGDATHTVPEVSVLEQLLKLIAKLGDQLEIVAEFDDAVIDEVNRLIENDGVEDGENESEQEELEEVEIPEADEEEEDVQENEDIEEEESKEDEEKDIEMNDANGEIDDEENIDEDQDEQTKESPVVNQNEDEEEDEADKQDEELDKDEFEDATDKIDGEEDLQEQTNNETIKRDLEEDEEGQPLEKKRKFSTAQIENDPSVKNPKSEYVTSQTLPAAAHALGLFNEEDGGLQHFGEDALKKRYAVSSYPKTDLKDKLPGVIPNIDFSKSKPANQVQFATFQTYIENFYRDFADDDLKFLKEKNIVPDTLVNDSTYDPNITPYLIPNLGPLYSTIWNEEENAMNYTPPPNVVTKESIIPRNSSEDLNDENLETEKISCGPLVSRLLSAILKDDKSESLENGNGVSNGILDEDDGSAIDTSKSITAFPEQQGWKVSSTNADYPTLEDRLKRELRYIGIFMNLNNSGNSEGFNKRDIDDDEDEDNEGELEPDWLNTEDDEISTELRRLQADLKKVSKVNNKRKRALIPIVENRLAWQEYLSILNDLEKQIDQAYVKRIRVPKNKKKKPTNATPLAQQQLVSQTAHQTAANFAIKSLLEKRIKWMNKIGPLFEKEGEEDSMKRHPVKSIFDDVIDIEADEDDEDDNGFDDGEDLGLHD